MDKDLHRKSNPQTTIAECWRSRNRTFIDVRSPKEFFEGHLPHAVNLPLLDDTERETVGVIYRRYGQYRAVEKGYDILEPKLDALKRHFDRFSEEKSVIIYCARGGMRSRVVTSLMRSFGYPAKQLQGGYKAFRNWNLNLLEQFTINDLIVLHGQTGVGKTLILNRLQNSIDLEKIAGHRGSMFGGIGKSPVTQKTFDSALLMILESIDNMKPVFIEGESRKIGKITIPRNIFNQMQHARHILLKAPIRIRAERIIEEYVTRQPTAIPEIGETIGYLRKDLGKTKVARLCRLFNEARYRECFEEILESYYDKKYSFGMKDLICRKEIWAEHIPTAVSETIRYSQSKKD